MPDENAEQNIFIGSGSTEATGNVADGMIHEFKISRPHRRRFAGPHINAASNLAPGPQLRTRPQLRHRPPFQRGHEPELRHRQPFQLRHGPELRHRRHFQLRHGPELRHQPPLPTQTRTTTPTQTALPTQTRTPTPTQTALPTQTATPSPTIQATGPNIVLIYTDDQPFGTTSLLSTMVSRPGSQSVRFQNAFATNPTCCPSRSTVLTGQYSNHHGVCRTNCPAEGIQI